MRLAHFGTFDVPNYGDLLFPRLAEARLAEVFDEIVHVSPVGGKVYRDVTASRSFADVWSSGESFDAVMVGGGNIVHANGSTLAEYHAVSQSAYPSLWLGAAQLAARHGVPLVTNAPGVPRDFGRVGKPLARLALRRADYLAVRDEFSAAMLAKAEVANVAVVPDSAIEIAKWFGYETPTHFDVPRDLSKALDGRIVSIHVNDRYSPKDPAELANAIDQIGSQLAATPVLIAIGPCHGDDAYSRKVGALMSSPHVVFDTPRAVEDIAHVISRSVAYVGSSMHGFITAASYGVPPLVVASHANQHKFRGLLSHVNGQDRLMEDWASAVARTTAPLEPVEVADARLRVEQHWQHLKMSTMSAVQHRRENLLLRSPLNLSSVFNARRLRARS